MTVRKWLPKCKCPFAGDPLFEVCPMCNGTGRWIESAWWEVKRVVNGEVKVTVCCCTDPGMSPESCSVKRKIKTKCRCDCHRIRDGELVKRERIE